MARAAASARLLDEALLAALQGLALPLRRARGALPGAHAGSQPGRGDDFFQHRAYVRGEDVRAIDWRASGRTGHLLVKERHRPLRQPLTLLVDGSASMEFPADPASKGKSKALCARQLGASLAVLALRRGDPVTLFDLDGAGFQRRARAVPGGSVAATAESLLGTARTVVRADAPRALLALRPEPLAGSHAVLLSDLYGDAALVGPAVAALVRAGVAVTVLHLLAEEERTLPAGVAALRDLETGEERAVGPAEAAALTLRLERWREDLRAAVERAGAEWLAVDAGKHPAAILRRWLRGRA